MEAHQEGVRTMAHVIETEKLHRQFGRIEAVQNLSLAVPEGSVFAFVGPNGAGKTTTMKILMNLLDPAVAAPLCWDMTLVLSDLRATEGSATFQKTRNSRVG